MNTEKISTASLVKALQAEATAFFDSYFAIPQSFKDAEVHCQDHFNNIVNLVSILQMRKSETFLDKLFKEVNR